MSCAEEREARAKYDEGKASASSQSAKSVLLNGLMAAKRDGKIPGIIGRLGSLGTIAPEYDVAISTACGALDNIVVADTLSAQACVALLREKQLGVATFLILDKQVAQWGTKMKEGFNCPKGASRLFDLVECSDDAHRAAFGSALRDTLVTADKAKANSIAFGGSVRHRVDDGRRGHQHLWHDGGGRQAAGGSDGAVGR